MSEIAASGNIESYLLRSWKKSRNAEISPRKVKLIKNNLKIEKKCDETISNFADVHSIHKESSTCWVASGIAAQKYVSILFNPETKEAHQFNFHERNYVVHKIGNRIAYFSNNLKPGIKEINPDGVTFSQGIFSTHDFHSHICYPSSNQQPQAAMKKPSLNRNFVARPTGEVFWLSKNGAVIMWNMSAEKMEDLIITETQASMISSGVKGIYIKRKEDQGIERYAKSHPGNKWVLRHSYKPSWKGEPNLGSSNLAVLNTRNRVLSDVWTDRDKFELLLLTFDLKLLHKLKFDDRRLVTHFRPIILKKVEFVLMFNRQLSLDVLLVKTSKIELLVSKFVYGAGNEMGYGIDSYQPGEFTVFGAKLFRTFKISF